MKDVHTSDKREMALRAERLCVASARLRETMWAELFASEKAIVVARGEVIAECICAAMGLVALVWLTFASAALTIRGLAALVLGVVACRFMVGGWVRWAWVNPRLRALGRQNEERERSGE